MSKGAIRVAVCCVVIAATLLLGFSYKAVEGGERGDGERQMTELKEWLAELNAGIDRAEGQIREIKNALEREDMTDARHRELKQEHEKNYKNIKKWSAQREEVKAKMHALEREFGERREGREKEGREGERDIEHRIRGLKERIAGHEAELKEARQHRKELDYKLEHHEMGPEDRAHLKRQLAECLACLEENERGLVEAKEELAHLLREIGHDESREEWEKPRDDERGKIEHALQEMHGYIRKLEGQAAEWENHIRELKRKLERDDIGEGDRREIHEKLKHAVHELEKTEVSLDEAHGRLRHLEEELEGGEYREHRDRDFEAEIFHDIEGEDAEWIRELLSEKNRKRLLRAIDDAFGDDFMDMRRHNLERFVMEHLDIIGELFELSFEDEYAYKLVVRGFQLERTIDDMESTSEELGHGIRNSDNEDRRHEWGNKLEKVLNELFELKLEFEELEIKHTEHILEKAHVRLNSRRENRGKIIERRYRELIGEEEDNEW